MRFYPNALTLHPEVTEQEVLSAAAPSGPFAVKDSFARLDLGTAGFRLLAEASWIAREGAPGGPPDKGLPWERVTRPGDLRDRRAPGPAAAAMACIRAGHVAGQRCAALACHREGTVIGGAVVYAAGGAAGISNLFSNGLPRTGYGPASSLSWLHGLVCADLAVLRCGWQLRLALADFRPHTASLRSRTTSGAGPYRDSRPVRRAG